MRWLMRQPLVVLYTYESCDTYDVIDKQRLAYLHHLIKGEGDDGNECGGKHGKWHETAVVWGIALKR